MYSIKKITTTTTTAWAFAVTCPLAPPSGPVLKRHLPGRAQLRPCSASAAAGLYVRGPLRLYDSASMTTIKEKAAALNLAEKLCVRPPGEPLIDALFVAAFASTRVSSKKMVAAVVCL